MIGIREFGFIDRISLNLDAGKGVASIRATYPQSAKNALSREYIYTHVNMQALERMALDSLQAAPLKFTVAPVLNPFKGEPNWKVVVDSDTTDAEKSAIRHAAKNVQRIFDLKDIYQDVRALIV